MAWLRVIGGPQDGQTFRVTEAPVTIGRGPANGIQIRDESVSRRHASLRWIGKTHAVSDLGSDNGVLVGDERIDRLRPLQHGDRIKLGGAEMVYESAPDIDYSVDYARQFKDAKSNVVRGETKAVTLAEVQAMMAEDGQAPVAAPVAVPEPVPTAPPPPAAPAAPPKRGGIPADLAPIREQILAALRRRIAGGIDAMAMTDLIIAGIARGLMPDRGAVLLRTGRQAVMKPVKTWQRPDVLPGTPMPPLLREIVLETVETRRPRGVATGTVVQVGGGVPRQAAFAAICAPIVSRGTLLGALYADNALRAGLDFTTDDLRFALDLASTVAPVLT